MSADARVPMTSRGYQFLMEELKRARDLDFSSRTAKKRGATAIFLRTPNFMPRKNVSRCSTSRSATSKTSLPAPRSSKFPNCPAIELSSAPRFHWPMVIPGRRWYIKSWVIMRRSQRTEKFLSVLPLPAP